MSDADRIGGVLGWATLIFNPQKSFIINRIKMQKYLEIPSDGYIVISR